MIPELIGITFLPPIKNKKKLPEKAIEGTVTVSKNDTIYVYTDSNWKCFYTDINQLRQKKIKGILDENRR